MKKVLILGGGFAALEAAISLRKEDFTVTVVSDRLYFYIYPTSIWVPTRVCEFDDVRVDLDRIANIHGFSLIIDPVASIEAAKKKVILHSGIVLDDYDYLIVAMGAHKMKHPGIEHTLSICGAPEQSLALRERLDALMEKGSGKIAMGFGGNPKESSAVRGGPAFELLFNVHTMLTKRALRDSFELTFFAPMPQPGARMGEKALTIMEKMFNKMKIERHFGKRFKQFDEAGITFEDDSRLDADLVMFIPAGNGHDVIKSSDLPTNEAGFVTVNDYGEVLIEGEEATRSHIYAVGDVAAIEGPPWRAKQGHVAEVMARNAAFNIAALERGDHRRKGYREHLNILCVMDTGDGAAFVYRDDKRAFMLPLPIVGHWLKHGWGWYCKATKLGRFPRLPGL